MTGRKQAWSRSGFIVPIVYLWLFLSACEQETSISCTSLGVTAIQGSVQDETGEPLLPDRVLVNYGHGFRECEISLVGSGSAGATEVEASFSCLGGGAGQALLLVYVGSTRLEERLELELDESGCHTQTQFVELTLEDASDMD